MTALLKNMDLLIGVLLVFQVVSCGYCKHSASVIRLNSDLLGAKFVGVGGLSAGASSRLLYDYSEPIRSHLLDLLFKPNYGASLHILKVEIGGDAQSTWGTEPSHMHQKEDENYSRGYEWWLMQEAKKRNPKIVISALAWGEPHWVGTDEQSGFFSDEGINYTIKWILAAEQIYKVNVDLIGIWNEKPYSAEYIKSLRRALNENGLQTTGIVAPDLWSWNIVDNMLKDPQLNESISVIGRHEGTTAAKPPADTWTLHKPSSASEMDGFDSPSPAWPSAQLMAKALIRYYLDANHTSAILCPLATAWLKNFQHGFNHGFLHAKWPWSGHYEALDSLWSWAHFGQFVEQGWSYLYHVSGEEGWPNGYFEHGGSYVTLTPKTGSSDFSMILETTSANATQTITLQLQGGLAQVQKATLWCSSEHEQFVDKGTVDFIRSEVTLKLPPDVICSLTTTSGQVKAETAPPPRGPLLLPYVEDFESRPVDGFAAYLSDYYGSFQIFLSAGADGAATQALRQWTLSSPQQNSWHAHDGPPMTYFPGNWMNYNASVQVLLGRSNGTSYDFHNPGSGKEFPSECPSARLCTRVEFLVRTFDPKGICFEINCSGQYVVMVNKLYYKNQILEHGVLTGFSADDWHAVTMEMSDYTLRVNVDGKMVLANTAVPNCTNGIVGIGSSWHQVLFDNFSLTTSRFQPRAHSALFLSMLPDSGNCYNYFNGWAGMVVDILKDVRITAFARFFAQGNNQKHQFQVFTTDGQPLLQTENSTIDMATEIPDLLGFSWTAPLAKPLALKAGRYYIVSSEREGGDMFLDMNSPGRASTADSTRPFFNIMEWQDDVATIQGRAQFQENVGTWTVHLEQNTCLGPLNVAFGNV